MPQLHFLNVGEGDCTWIAHADGKNSVVDICNGNTTTKTMASVESLLIEQMEASKGLRGNFQQKKYPVNPIEYLRSFGVSNIFRFVASHPDMDHLDGLKAFFERFRPTNFWDTDNCKEIEDFGNARFLKADWDFYKGLRSGSAPAGAKRLTLHSGAQGAFYNESEDGKKGGNGLEILSPTQLIVSDANECGDFNDCSYVILYRYGTKKVIIGGDSHDTSWEHILSNHRSAVENVDLLIAPHHGRDSDRSYEFLDVLKPKLTFFGVARSEHLGYSAWRNRGLEVMTNNQGGTFVVDFVDGRMDVHCTNRAFAQAYRREKYDKDTFLDAALKSWYVKSA